MTTKFSILSLHASMQQKEKIDLKMEKEPRRIIFGSTPIIFLFSLPLLYVGVDFFCGNRISMDRWVQYFSSSETSFNKTIDDKEFMNFHLSRLVRGEDRRNLETSGFACDKTFHSLVCVSNHPVRIDTNNMTVYVPSDSQNETVVRPYAKQESELEVITPVHMIQYLNTTITPPDCQYTHQVPAVIFSSGSTGNVFHEMNEIITPLYITTKHFQSRIVLILEDYKPSFMSKYGKILAHLSSHEVINPGINKSVHCFPGSVVGLRYHDNLAINSSEIPGGYLMSDFKHFLRQAYSLKFEHVSQIGKPRLMLLSRTNTRRFLNEDEMVSLMQELGFQVIVVRRSKVISNLSKFTQLVNSCSVLVGTHGAGLTNELFLPTGAVLVQVEVLGTEWGSNHYYGDTAPAMGVKYLRYKIEGEESSLSKLYGRNSSVVMDPDSVYRNGGYIKARAVFLDQQNVRINLLRFRQTLVEALSIVTNLER
ncbi:hypothetical protein ACJIZ3_006968 [Penstemon smallii]|uniref:Glycosyltransferase 61 catalytic domain-containing protein n=1 Tax=Penstemon smallii TaxID=265156 RepID=A0ABD3S968_9LAMI